MNYSTGQRVNRIEDRVRSAALIVEVRTQADNSQVLLLAYDEGGFGWWPSDALTWEFPADPARGQEWVAPDGATWRWDQPCDPQTGQYLADDPATPEGESALQWICVAESDEVRAPAL